MMADPSPLAGLLDRAGRVFSMAWDLARAFTGECLSHGQVVVMRTVDPTAWSRHQPAFDVFCNALLDLRDEMRDPPDGFGPVAEVLLEAAGVAREIRNVMQTPYGRMWQSFTEFRYHFNSIGAKGDEAIRRIKKAQRLDDPFAFLDQPAAGSAAGTTTPPTVPKPSAGHIEGTAREIPSKLADEDKAPTEVPGERRAHTPADPPEASAKRSTERGEGRLKLICALTKHHRYADGSCLNLEPVGNNELAKAADVSPSTASAFFDREFLGHTRYKALCRDAGGLAAALKLLNNEFAPHNLYGGRPADEGDERNLK